MTRPGKVKVSDPPAEFRGERAGGESARDELIHQDAVDQELAWHDPRWRGRVRRRLLGWFDTQARSLPWRDHPTPYHVWVSEIMLQQTQVATVIDYYRRFLAAFPTIADLAAAPEERLMRLWEGLGYYRRARSMHAAAKRIVEQHGGVFPTTFDEVLALPGIGRYTAGAILSISADRRYPVLEGNTQRVYSRWIGLRQDVTTAAAKTTLWDVADKMLPRTGSGGFNQAAMELGSLVCKPKEPLCHVCPVRNDCQAHRLGLQDEIPGKVTRVEYESRNEFGFIVPTREQSVLVQQIPAGQRWAGLWDFPRWTDGDVADAAAAARALSRQWGISIRPTEKWLTIKHAVTRYRITLEVHRAKPIDAAAIPTDQPHLQVLPIDRLADLPLSATGRKIARSLSGS
jgi:A/G-specific adenine glycosylase